MKRRFYNKTLYNNVYSQLKPPKTTTPLQLKTQWALCGLSVYRFVFTTKVAFGAALLLCASLLLQPVAFVYAEEPVVDATAEVEVADLSGVDTSVAADVDSTDEPAADVTEEATKDGDGGSSEDDSSSSTAVDSPKVTPASDTPQTAGTSPVPATSTDENSGTSTVIAESTTTPNVAIDEITATTTRATTSAATDLPAATSTATSSPTSTAAINSSTAAINSSEPDETHDTTEAIVTTSSSSAGGAIESTNLNEPRDDEVSTSSATITQPATSDVSTTQTDNAFAFNKNECTEVEDGSFYCQKVSSETMMENDLISAPDATGDMEIYVIQNGEQIQVTDNAVDDASPYYDARSKTIVWHRLINDRYQIISYDVETQVETQLTDTSVNNMEPTKNGEYVVWQRWVQNNWEIILRQGERETQITDSIEHDIAPHIRGDLIIWNVRSSDGSQSLMTYDIGSGAFNEIKDTDGVSVTNPRMLVMYEAQYQNGDTVMKGFDLVTGEIIPIERIPRDLPPDIPSPEATGEVRALPTNPQTEEELASDSDIDTDEPTDKDTPQYNEDDLVLNATTTATSTPTTESVDFDLDLRPDDAQLATTTDGTVIDQAAIPDVVVPEYTAKEEVNQASSTQRN